ncbi:VOC family protein [Longispora albida]|uniref:VOC family protein n=1 Tax=Longispora albida TaxID=203523 RepID=UPI00037DD5AC|nr:VOC family protein [Longispora albida]
MAGTSSFELKTVVFDARDHRGLARFYAELTGGEERYADDEWVTVFTGDGWRLGFQAAPDHVAPEWPGQARPQQMHLDFQVADLAAATTGAERLGARRIGGGDTWNVMADPAGHPFCLCAGEHAEPIRTYGVSIDCSDGGPLAVFYAELLGYTVKYQQDGMAWIGTATPAPMGEMLFQAVEGYNPPQWPDPAHPQQLHLDITVSDIEAAERRALELGATRLPGDGENWRVYADPAGHPFCLLWMV